VREAGVEDMTEACGQPAEEPQSNRQFRQGVPAEILNAFTQGAEAVRVFS
jgi:hypothetical protein